MCYDGGVMKLFISLFLAVGILAAGGPAAPATKQKAVRTDHSFTVSAWVKLARLGVTQSFVSQSGSPAFSLEVRADKGDRFAFAATAADSPQGAVQAAASDFAPTPGVWYQVAGVYDASVHQLRLYADGTRLASVSARLWNAGGPEKIGTGGAANDAQIAQVRLVPRALSDPQILASYQAQLKQFPPNTFTWANPIYFQGNGPGDDIHDPDILQDNGAYYCVATLAPFRNYTDCDPKLPDLGSAPGIALYASHDLKAWNLQCWLFKSSALPINCPYKHQFWAPEIHKFNGRYYIIFGGSNWIDAKYNIGQRMGYYQFVGVADKITGPYTHVTALNGPGVDTSLFQDDDGKTYAVWPRNEIHRVDLSQINQGVITVGPKLSQAATEADFKALGKPAPNTIEGPYLIKRRGTYYCFFAETYPDLYATGVATSQSLSGPWTLDPRWRVFPGGHQALFTGPDGRFWTAYKHEKSGTTPWLSIDPVDFDANGSVEVTPTEGPQSVPLAK